MDLAEIKDIDKLKSLAFDQIQTINQAQQNLNLIQQRIKQVEEPPPTSNKE